MGKDLRISLLLDFYGQMLTEKQREAVELYYNEDLSLGEIADNCHITRQGVRDNIKRAEAMLLEFEEQLGLARRFREIQQGLDRIAALAKEIDYYNERYSFSNEIAQRAQEIVQVAQSINE